MNDSFYSPVPPMVQSGGSSDSLDYVDVGLVAGLEVHQQLLTERKLFCRCPAGLYTSTHDGVVLRHMRPTLSELGEYDGTALMEFKTKKNIMYLLHKSNVCTYEMDDTPPFLLNQQAVDVAIEQCLMLGCDIIDEVHIARKQYLDGSIPTGFQRTAIVGVNGKLPFRGRTLTVTQVSVEEDSCREVSDQGHLIVWRADRLGMPLIETVTAPELRTPAEVAEAILLIGRVCRSTGHVRVGLGASRQDVNVSVRGGRRVEIKGVSRAGWAPALVHGEAWRQVNLLALRDELHQRGFKQAEDIDIEQTEVTRLFEKSPLEFLRADGWEQFARAEGRRPGFELGEGPFCVRAVRLKGLVGTLNWPTQPDRTFAHELAGRIRVIAALDQQPILLHSEKWPDYAGSPRALRQLRRSLRCDLRDAVVLVWGPLEDTLTAVEEIRLRYVAAVDGVPCETRQPHADGSTDFERILPGPDRMYPDTDSPATRMTQDRVTRLRAGLPAPPWEREARYQAAGIPTSTIHYLIRRGGAAFVDEVASDCPANLRLAGFFFGERLKGLGRAGVPLAAISKGRWRELFEQFARSPVVVEAWKRLVVKMAATPEVPVEEIVELEGLGAGPPDWRALVLRTVATMRPHHPMSREGAERFFLGRIMAQLRGRVAAKDVTVELRDVLSRVPGGGDQWS